MNLAYLSDKYVKSATKSKKYNQLTQRILAVSLYLVWTLCLFTAIAQTKNGFIAIPKYFEAKQLLQEHNERWKKGIYDVNTWQWRDLHPDIDRFQNHTNNSYWLDYPHELPRSALEYQLDNLKSLWIFAAYLVAIFIVPWLITRLFFWLYDADRSVKV